MTRIVIPHEQRNGRPVRVGLHGIYPHSAFPSRRSQGRRARTWRGEGLPLGVAGVLLLAALAGVALLTAGILVLGRVIPELIRHLADLWR